MAINRLFSPFVILTEGQLTSSSSMEIAIIPLFLVFSEIPESLVRFIIPFFVTMVIKCSSSELRCRQNYRNFLVRHKGQDIYNIHSL